MTVHCSLTSPSLLSKIGIVSPKAKNGNSYKIFLIN